MRHASLIVAVLAILSFDAYVAVLVIFHPAMDADLKGLILGVLGTGGFGTAVAYFLGSSAGSAEKTAVIKNLTLDGNHKENP